MASSQDPNVAKMLEALAALKKSVSSPVEPSLSLEEKPIDVRVVQHYDVNDKGTAYSVMIANGILVPLAASLAYRAFVRRFTREVLGYEVVISRTSAYKHVAALAFIKQFIFATPPSKHTTSRIAQFLSQSS